MRRILFAITIFIFVGGVLYAKGKLTLEGQVVDEDGEKIKKDYKGAKAHFLNVFNYTNEDSIAQYNLFMIDGHLLRGTGNKEKLWDAIELYYKAIRIQPLNGEPYFFIGKAYESLGNKDFDLILESYQKALSLHLSSELKEKVEAEISLVSDREKKLKDFWK